MALESAEVNRWYESLRDQKLDQNEKSAGIWCKYKSDLENTKFLLSLLPKKLTHNVMIPIGPKALMRGKIVHTNEFLVNLGETWFIKRSACQTLEICDRRMKTCDEMIQNLQKEKELILSKVTLPEEQDAFGSKERPEIIEYVTEEENETWVKEHRIKEREYRQKLAELRKKEKTIESEEDLWKHLDELELQEELEDELNRLNEENSNESDNNSDSNNDSVLNIEKISLSNTESFNYEKQENDYNNKNDQFKSKKNKISFASDLIDDEPLMLKITHTKVEPSVSFNDLYINSPKDIYDRYLKLLVQIPTPVLKNPVNPNKDKELEKLKQQQRDLNENESDTNLNAVSNNIKFNDILERNPEQIISNQQFKEKNKKISKFKASRTKI